MIGLLVGTLRTKPHINESIPFVVKETGVCGLAPELKLSNRQHSPYPVFQISQSPHILSVN